MSTESNITPKGVKVSSCASSAQYPHNKGWNTALGSQPHNTSQSKVHMEITQTPIDDALDLMRRNMSLWGSPIEINEPGFTVTDVNKEIKLVGDDECGFSSSSSFWKPKSSKLRYAEEELFGVLDELQPSNSAFVEIKESVEPEVKEPESKVKEIASVTAHSTAKYFGGSENLVNEHIKQIKEIQEAPETILNYPNEIPAEMPTIRSQATRSVLESNEFFNPLEEMLALSGLGKEIEGVIHEESAPVRRLKKKRRPIYRPPVDDYAIDGFEIDEKILHKTWQDISEAQPDNIEAKEFSAYYKRNVVKDPITFLNTWKYNDIEVLELSGIETTDTEVEDDFRAALLRYVTNDDLPEGVNLGLNEDVLLINGAPTRISSKAIEMAFCGLAELMGAKESVEFVGSLVSKKLKTVF